MASENGLSEGIGFLLGMTTETVTEPQEKANVIVATPQPIPVPEAGDWPAILAKWAASALGKPVAVPTVPVADTIPAGTRLALGWPPGQTPDADPETQFHSLAKFRIVWPPAEGAEPDLDAPRYADFDPAWHARDGRTLPEAPFVSFDAETWTIAFDTRYRLPQDPSAPMPAPKVAQRSHYYVSTGQESDAVILAAADGQRGRNWRNRQDGVRLHQARGGSHRVEVALAEEEKALGYGVEFLEALTGCADADAALVFYYGISLLAPPPGTAVPEGYAPQAWLDIDDIAEKAEKNFRVLPAEKKQEARLRAWNYIRFIARARVVGKRTIPYVDGDRNEIDTRIEAPAWVILSEQKPAQQALFADADVPVRVEIGVSRAWLPLLTHGRLAQFLPAAERLGLIAGNTRGGAYARAMGLVLFRLFRLDPRAAVAEGIEITRRELLTRFTPRGGSVEDVLKSEDPGRAVTYYAHGLDALRDEAGIVSAEAEAAPGIAKKRLGADGTPLPRKGWQEAWLDAKVRLHPGPALRPALEECARNLPPVARPKRLPGRPRRTRPS